MNTDSLVHFLQHLPLIDRATTLLPDHRQRHYLTNPSRGLRRLCRGFKLLARASGYRRNCERQVRYVNGAHHFDMRLNVNETSQCEYYFFIPNARLKEAICGGGEVFIDIGANVGVFSLMAAAYFKKVLAFEPMPETYARLSKNIEISQLGNISAHPFALSDHSGEAKINKNPMNLGGSSLAAFPEASQQHILKGQWESFAVKLETLDGFLKTQSLDKLDLLKIDVEGHEVEAISGARETIARFKPKLFVEVSHRENFHRLRALLPRSYHAYDPESGAELEDWVSYDVCFISP